MHHPAFSQIEWLKVKNEMDQGRKGLVQGNLFGLDINKNAVRASKINLKAAGFHNEVEIIQADFREYTPSVTPNLLLTNPPHGKRLEEVDSLRPLYRALGDFMKRKCAKPSKGFIFTGSLELTKEVGLAAKRRYPLNNGGVESRLLEFEIY